MSQLSYRSACSPSRKTPDGLGLIATLKFGDVLSYESDLTCVSSSSGSAIEIPARGSDLGAIASGLSWSPSKFKISSSFNL